MAEKIRVRCGRCGTDVLVRVDQTLRVHGKEESGEPCAMSGAPRLTAHDAPPRLVPPVTEISEEQVQEDLSARTVLVKGTITRTDGTETTLSELTEEVLTYLHGGSEELGRTAPPRITPSVTETPKGLWFGAMYDGGIACGHTVSEGDMIRADGKGGFECGAWCGQDDAACLCTRNRSPENYDGPDQECPDHGLPGTRGTWERPTAANVAMPVPGGGTFVAPAELFPDARMAPPTPSQVEEAYTEQGLTVPSIDAFLTPAGVGHPVVDAFLNNAPQTDIDAFLTPGTVPSATQDAGPGLLRVRTRNYKHQVKDPRTGEFRLHKNGNIDGFTRVSTFVKAASDSTALNEWSKRNVLVGASRRPDLVNQAHGLDVRNDSRRLNELVEKLETAADAKVSADLGTQVHDLTERIDRKEITLADVPPAFRPHIASYTEALLKAGLEVIPHLMERTVFIEKYEVVGSFDRILYHRPSNTYVCGDVKTGKNLEYGWDEIEAQEWMYAEGYNLYGTYEWEDLESDRDKETWTPPEFQVRTDVGVVMWIPVDPSVPESGTCRLRMTDLIRGRSHAALCGDVRAGRKRKGKPVPWSSPARDWGYEFGAVTSAGAAGVLWQAAKDAGVEPLELNRLVALAQDRIRTRASQMAE